MYSTDLLMITALPAVAALVVIIASLTHQHAPKAAPAVTRWAVVFGTHGALAVIGEGFLLGISAHYVIAVSACVERVIWEVSDDIAEMIADVVAL